MNRKQRIVFFVLLALGIVARIFGAWAYRECLNPDAGVVALMAKHMVEGKGIPIFFYGQAYMGTLEPMVSALFCSLLGISGFAVCLGTAVFGMLLLPVLYIWGKEAGGVKAGLAAMAYLVLGPGGYFHYMGSPRGGYASAFFFSSLLLWLGGHILREELRGRQQHAGWYLLLGSIAGVAWWCNQIVTGVFLTLAVLYLVLLNVRLLTWRIVPGILGFFMGGLEFWVWNIRNDWGTFSFLNSFRRPSLLEGLHIFFIQRTPQILDSLIVPPVLRYPLLAFYAGALLWFFSLAVRSLRRRERIAQNVHFIIISVFFVIFTLLFSVSHFAHFGTPRYLLPLNPPLAVILGVMTARLDDKLPYGLAWIPISMLILFQCYVVLPGDIRLGLSFNRRMADAEKLGDFLREQDVRVIFGRYGFYSRNFILNEEFIFTSPNGDRYKPYEYEAEAATKVAALGSNKSLEWFIEETGGEFEDTKVGGLKVFHDITRSDIALREWSPDLWRSAVDSRGRDVRETLTDRDVDTAFLHRRGDTADEIITVELHQPTEVSGLRIVWRYGKLGVHRLAVYGRIDKDADWQRLLSETDLTDFFWSGPRYYYDGIHYRGEKRFSPVTVRQIKFVFPFMDFKPEWEIGEIALLGDPHPRESEIQAVPKLVDVLAAKDIKHLYSDRWVANAIKERMKDSVLTETEPTTYPRSEERNPPNEVQLRPDTALMTLSEDAPVCRQVLAARKVVMSEQEVGPWTLFYFGPDTWKSEYSDFLGLYWTGYTCLLYEDKHWAGTLARRAERLMKEDPESAEALALLREASAYLPFSPEVTKMYTESLRANGFLKESAQMETVTMINTPRILTPVTFKNGVRLLGMTVDPMEASPGQTIQLRYFWNCPPDVVNKEWAVFVHIDGEGKRFQDDHVFLDGFHVEDQPFAETYIEDRRLTIPEDAEPGSYTVRIGLYHRVTGKRLASASEFPTRARSVELPVNLQVTKLMSSTSRHLIRHMPKT